MPLPRYFVRLGGLFLVLLLGVATTPHARAAGAQPLVGIFTDNGWDDPSIAQLKGTILTIAPRTQVLDLIHSATPFGMAEGAYLLDQAVSEFPSGTVFVVVVEAPAGPERDPILLLTGKGKFYIGRDNGLFTRVIDREGFSRAWKLNKEDIRQGNATRTLHGRELFGPVAAHLADGADPEKLGTPLKTISMLPTREASYSAGTISAEVQYIDRSGDVVLGLHSTDDVATKLKEGNLVKILAGRESFSGPLVKSYGEVAKGRLLLLYGGNGQLEISMNQGSAARMLKVEPGTVIFLKP